MNLARYVHPRRVLTLRSGTKAEVFRQLVDSLAETVEGLDCGAVMAGVEEREQTVSTRVKDCFAMPHARVANLPGPCFIAIARVPDGIDYEDKSDEPVRVVILVAVHEAEPELFLSVLAAVAECLRADDVTRSILEAESAEEVLRFFADREPAAEERLATELYPLAMLMISSVRDVAERTGARAILAFSELLESPWLVSHLPRNRRLILAGRRVVLPEAFRHPDVHLVQVPIGGDARTRQIRLVLLFCLGRGLLEPKDTVVCLSGQPGSGLCDTMVVTRVDRECHLLPSAGRGTLPADVRAEVLERTVELACEIAEEGREGRTVGTLFVLGDHEHVLPWTKQLVINPFQGHPEESRNILDPTLSETIKEFSGIDGAFVVRGDGVVLAAGTYLRPNTEAVELPSGLGARHQAAAAISAVTQAYGIAVSESSGTVTIYRDGSALTVIERSRR